ncbi:MAG TPA: cupin domain-containing protein [Xanthobacteraceae bacterium]|nr:cupin domain-containing protein [Xanthobacteraceae bacterium]
MPKVDLSKASVRTTSAYPQVFKRIVEDRAKQVLGDAVGLTQFGVNLTKLKPGAASALRHWHEKEDEFIYIVSGEAVLIEDGGETILKAGEAAGFPAGIKNGHHLVNRSARDVVYLEIGSRLKGEIAHYPDDDLAMRRDANDKLIFTRKSGEDY